jgi:hypothetical protein
MASDTGAPLTFPHCKQQSRLFEAIGSSTIKRPRKWKTSIRKFVFFGKLAKPRGSPSQETRIITELGMPVQDAFDALLIMNLGRAGVSGEAKVGSNSESGAGLLSSPGTVGREESSESCPLFLLMGKKHPKHFKEKCFTF